MSDPSDIDLDDLVTEDRLEDALSEVKSEIPDDTSGITPEQVRDIAHEVEGQKFAEGMQHLISEPCDNDACHEIRNRLGIDMEPDAEDDGSDDDGSADPDADDSAEDDADDSTEAEGADDDDLDESDEQAGEQPSWWGA